jgi:hypothetical protein
VDRTSTSEVNDSEILEKAVFAPNPELIAKFVKLLMKLFRNVNSPSGSDCIHEGVEEGE